MIRPDPDQQYCHAGHLEVQVVRCVKHQDRSKADGQVVRVHLVSDDRDGDRDGDHDGDRDQRLYRTQII